MRTRRYIAFTKAIYITVRLNVTRLCLTQCPVFVQYNFNGSDTDGSFTMANSNSFLSPWKILPKAKGNKYLGIFLGKFRMKVCCVYSLESPHQRILKRHPCYPVLPQPGTTINRHCLKLPMSGINFHGPTAV